MTQWPYTGDKPVGKSRKYIATIKPKPEVAEDPAQVSVSKMVIEFTIGAEAPYNGPEPIIEDTLARLHLTGLMDVEYRIWRGDRGRPWTQEEIDQEEGK